MIEPAKIAKPAAEPARQTGYPDGVYLVRGGIIRTVTETILARCLWSDGLYLEGDVIWARQILEALQKRSLPE